MNFKKGFVIIFVTASLFASENNQLSSSNENKTTCCAQNTCKCAQSYNSCNCCQPKCCCNTCNECDNCNVSPQQQCCEASYLKSSRIETRCGNTWNVNASFLYWYAREENLDVGNQIIRSNAQGDFYHLNEVNPLEMPFEYNPGFKVGIGMNTCLGEWSLNLEYLRYHIDLSNFISLSTINVDASGAQTNLILPNWSPNGDFQNVTLCSGAKNKWNLGFDIIDFEIDGQVFLKKCLMIRPFAGIRGGIIDQKYNVRYIYDNIINDVFFSSFCNTNAKSESWLIGPKCGLETKWNIYKCFSFIANTSLSVFYQKFDLSVKNIGNIGNDIFSDIRYFAEKTVHQVSESFEAGIGFEFGGYLCNKRYHYLFDATYDWTLYLNQNWMRTFINNSYIPVSLIQIRTISVDSSPGNLMFHGLTLTARIDF